MPALLASNSFFKPVAQALRIDRECDARVDAVEIERDFADIYGATVTFYNPHQHDLEGFDPRIGYLHERPPFALNLPQHGRATNRAVAYSLLGQWLENAALDLLGATPDSVHASYFPDASVRDTSTFRLSPKRLSVAGEETGFHASNSRYFQAMAALILQGDEHDAILCEMFVRAIDSGNRDMQQLIGRMSEIPMLTDSTSLKEYASTNLIMGRGPSHVTNNVLATTILAKYLTDLAVSRTTEMLGLDA